MYKEEKAPIKISCNVGGWAIQWERREPKIEDGRSFYGCDVVSTGSDCCRIHNVPHWPINLLK